MNYNGGYDPWSLELMYFYCTGTMHLIFNYVLIMIEKIRAKIILKKE